MTTTANKTADYSLPVRMAFTDVRWVEVVAGTRGSHGDAGWSVINCSSAEERAAIAQEYPQARMPCWKRLGL